MNGLIVTAAEVELKDTLYEDVTFPDGSRTIIPLGKVVSISKSYNKDGAVELWARPHNGLTVTRTYAHSDLVKVVR
jgi:hypothetical protein